MRLFVSAQIMPQVAGGLLSVNPSPPQQAAIIAAVLASKGGFMAAYAGLAAVSDASASTMPGVFASFFGPDPLNLLGVVLWML